MADIYAALKHLSFTEWSDVPTDDLKPYLTESFEAGELICNSIPPQPHGTPFEEAKPYHEEPNKATSHKDMHPSTVLSQPPSEDHGALSKHWGKPQKLKNNPLNVQIYKMAGNDRNGAWFARKSVHEGLGFDKMKRAMLREFPLSMSVKGGPGAGAVRGIAADKRLERKDVDGVGKLEVYQLSAQFPGPTTPREFVAMLLSSDEALTNKSTVKLGDGKEHTPRHFMLVSRPIDHPDADERTSYVRGRYESVEMIREIPLSTSPAKITRVVTSGDEESKDTVSETGGAASDPELNPVEWIMVTRSDPGGGLPRFLVERGTPDSILSDVHKFFDWACSQDEIPHPDDDLPVEETSIEPQADVETNRVPAVGGLQEKDASSIDGAPQPTSQTESQGGVLSNIASAIGVGIQTYAPAPVASLIQPHTLAAEDDSSLISDESDSSSSDSFLSADEMRQTTPSSDTPRNDADSLSVASGLSQDSAKTTHNHHDKEVQKLIKKRERLDQQLAKRRIAEEAKVKHLQEKDSEEQAKYQEKMEKELKKTEEKHRKEVEKLEAKKAKEARKAEEKRAKKDNQTRLNMLIRERDEFRAQKDLLKRENALLLEQVAELQSQNNSMAQRLGKDALKSIRSGSPRERTNSMKSNASSSSGVRS